MKVKLIFPVIDHLIRCHYRLVACWYEEVWNTSMTFWDVLGHSLFAEVWYTKNCELWCSWHMEESSDDMLIVNCLVAAVRDWENITAFAIFCTKLGIELRTSHTPAWWVRPLFIFLFFKSISLLRILCRVANTDCNNNRHNHIIFTSVTV